MAGEAAMMKNFFKAFAPPSSSSTKGTYEYTFCIDKPSVATVKIKIFQNAPVINISKGKSWMSLSVHEFESLVDNADEFKEKIAECREALDPQEVEERNYSVISSKKMKIDKRRKKKRKVAEEEKSTLELTEVEDD